MRWQDTKGIKIIGVLLFIVIYGGSIVWCRGRLSNQTATMAEIANNKTFSLTYDEAASFKASYLPLNKNLWSILGKDAGIKNSDDGDLIINGTVNNYTEPLFKALYMEPLNFSEFPFLHIVISGSPYIVIDLLMGLNENATKNEEFVRISPSSQCTQLIDDEQDHIITINVKEKIGASSNYTFLMIGANCTSSAYEKSAYYVKIKALCLWNILPYCLILSEGKSAALQEDKSSVFVIKNEDITITKEAYPYLQRIYVKYSIDAPKDALYTIFLVKKDGEKMLAARSAFLFSHSADLNEIGTYIDWRNPINLNPIFDPISTLSFLISDDDYAIIFSSVNNSKLCRVQLHEIELTYSKIQFSQFTITNLSDQVLVTASIFLLIIAGVVPTAAMIILAYKFLAYKSQIALPQFSKGITNKIVAAAMAIRLILAPITAYADDLQIFTQLGALYFGSGVLGAQWVSLPGYVYIQTFNYFPYALLRTIGFQDFYFLSLAAYVVESFITKLPSVLSDLGSVYYLRKMSQKFMPNKETLVTASFMFNPLTIYTSAILGQFDSIFTFTLIASIYYLTTEHNDLKATLYSCFAAIINPIGIAVFIALLADINKKRGVLTAFKSLILLGSIFSISIIPFLFETKSPVLLASYQRFLSGIPGESFYGKLFSFCKYGSYILSSVGYGLNYRALLELLGCYVGSFVYPYGAATAFLIFVMFFVARIHKTKTTDTHYNFYVGGFMLGVVALFQLTFPLIFEQFVIWVVGLLLISYILSSDRKFLLIAMIISIAAGFVYVTIYRNYLLLITGVQKVPFDNPELVNWASATIGILYSATLTAALIALLIGWCTCCSKRLPQQTKDLTNSLP